MRSSILAPPFFTGWNEFFFGKQTPNNKKLRKNQLQLQQKIKNPPPPQHTHTHPTTTKNKKNPKTQQQQTNKQITPVQKVYRLGSIWLLHHGRTLNHTLGVEIWVECVVNMR